MEIIREIYKGLIQNSKYMETAEKTVMCEIEKLTMVQKQEMPWKEYEMFRAMLFEISAIAQEEAFILGVRYGMKLMQESIYQENAKEF